MAEESLDEALDSLLNKGDKDFPDFADLPSLWRYARPESCRLNRTGIPNRMDLLRAYIEQSETESWAREGLRRLLNKFRENGQDVPEILKEWAIDQFVRGDPRSKPGRPKKSERDRKIMMGYMMLRAEGYSSEAAIGHIAYLMDRKEETVQSIVRKYIRFIPSPVKIRALFSP